MKKVKRILTIIGSVFLAVFFAAVVFRIFVQDYYPAVSTKLYYTEPLAEYYAQNNGLPDAVTQKLRTPYNTRPGKTEDEKSTVDGTFLATGLIWTPGADNVQITVRYNFKALGTVEDAYEEMGHEVSFGEHTKELFTYQLTVQYYNEETKSGVQKTYNDAYHGQSRYLLYYDNKLVFDGVEPELEGMSVRWMRVDIYLTGYTEVYGHISIYETETEIRGVMVPVATKPYVPGRKEIPEN